MTNEINPQVRLRELLTECNRITAAAAVSGWTDELQSDASRVRMEAIRIGDISRFPSSHDELMRAMACGPPSETE